MSPDPERVAAFIREAAETDIMPRFRSLAAHEVTEKKPGDVVTVADHDAEERLTRMLEDLTPGALVVGEEAAHYKPHLLDKLDREEGPLWIIDPVDGTANFAASRPVFAVMVAYINAGETRFGWIYDPVNEVMSVAELGSGARVNGTPVRIDDTVEPLIGRVNFGLISQERRAGVRQRLEDRFTIEKSMRCAGHEFASMAISTSQFRLYNRLWAWDHAPGVLINREAGGHVARQDGAAYRPTERTRGLLSAPNVDLWHRINEILQPD
ncbi:MAG: inositol monophosphatase [Alphaproteobacteria bacterium]|nr:inositol monophosphatase [Alphaproteobacteria bacterium]